MLGLVDHHVPLRPEPDITQGARAHGLSEGEVNSFGAYLGSQQARNAESLRQTDCGLI
jgi:hypothetical protein